MATWYVRPNTSHSGTRNGTSYATAWGGWSEIVWGVGGVVGGDTLYVCGAHSYSAANASVGTHGGSSTATICTIRGDYAGDPGSIAFTGAYYFQLLRSYTTVEALTITPGTSALMVVAEAITNVNIVDVVFDGLSKIIDNPMLHFYVSATGRNQSAIVVDGCTFKNSYHSTGNGGNLGKAIEWSIQTSGWINTLSNVRIRNCKFQDMLASRAIVGLVVKTTGTDSSVISDVEIHDNKFYRCRGVGIEAGHFLPGSAGVDGAVHVYDNEFYDITPRVASNGGAIIIWSTTGSKVYGNIGERITGANGFMNVFYMKGGRFYDNECDSLYTSTIDGCGILFDHGNDGCVVFNNTFRNLYGASGIPYSGVGILILDSTNIVACGNLVINAKTGVHFGTASPGQSCTLVNNTFANCGEYGIHIASTADLANCVVKNNIFTGDGYSVYDLTATSWSAENYNCFYGFASGTTNHTLGANSKTSDPLLDASYRPTGSSPCRGAGIYIAGARHMGGKKLAAAPDIGAHRYYTERTVSDTRTLKASITQVSSRNLTIPRAT